uniref:NIF3-like protein 1 n=2 Tax=Schistocephalus solidus TaxID=70667 RepID=A0A0X3P939_SCHSO
MDSLKFVRALDRAFKLPLAEPWDNVGLLIQPSVHASVKRILLTIDLTEPVLQEAVTKNVNFILSYHPPIFRPFKRLTQDHWKERIIVQCIENKIGVYSPHTALDAVNGGINDWLISPFETSKVLPIQRHKCTDQPTLYTVKCGTVLQGFCMKEQIAPLPVDSCSTIGRSTQLELASDDVAMALGDTVLDTSQPINFDSAEGPGRIALLSKPCAISSIVDAYKRLLGVEFLKVALGAGKKMDSLVACVAVCAGSGGSMFSSEPMVRVADLLFTGEASHHEQLDVVSRGVTVITAGHSVSERGYLSQRLKPWLERLVSELSHDGSDVVIEVSATDAEPGIIM